MDDQTLELDLDTPATALAGPAPTPAEVAVLRQFRQVFNAVKTHFQQVEKQAGVGGAQLWALSVVQGRPGIGINELARALDVHQSTASNLVRALVQRGLLDAAKDDQDRRMVRLRVLPAGRIVLTRAPGPFAGVLPDALSKLEPATLKRLQRDLGTLIDLLEAPSEMAQVPMV